MWICLHIGTCPVHIWRSEDNMQVSSPFLHHCATSECWALKQGCRVWWQVPFNCCSISPAKQKSFKTYSPLYSERVFRSVWDCSSADVFLRLLSFCPLCLLSATPTPSLRFPVLEVKKHRFHCFTMICFAGLFGEALRN